MFRTFAMLPRQQFHWGVLMAAGLQLLQVCFDQQRQPFTVGVSAFLLVYWLRKETITLRYFSYLSGCALTAVTAVDNLPHLMTLSRYGTFNPVLRPWYPHSIRFPMMIWYFIYQATYVSQFHDIFSPSHIDICKAISASDAVALTWFRPNHQEWMA